MIDMSYILKKKKNGIGHKSHVRARNYVKSISYFFKIVGVKSK